MRFQAVLGGSRGLQGPPEASRGLQGPPGGGGGGNQTDRVCKGFLKGSERPEAGCLGE